MHGSPVTAAVTQVLTESKRMPLHLRALDKGGGWPSCA